MPLRPSPYDPRQVDFRRDYLNWIRSTSQNIDSDIAAADRKWRTEDYERSKYDQFQFAKQNATTNAKYAEWIADCESDWNDASKPVPPDFPEWMQLDKNLPRIRTANPPLSNIEEASRLNSARPLIEMAGMVLVTVFLLAFIAEVIAGETFLAFLAVIVVAFGGWGLYTSRNDQQTRADQKRVPLPSHIYNREYTAPLADNSVVKTNIFFTLPQTFTRLDNQLDTFTEKEFLIFIAPKMIPPSADEIQNHLSKRLLPFQDENQIPFLRVEISLHIHIPAQKPKGGGFVSV